MNIGSNVKLIPKIKISSHKNLHIGNDIYIGPNSHLYSEGIISIKDGTIIGPNLIIYSSNHKYKDRNILPYESQADLKKVSIGKGCWIGDSVIISPGTSIGDGCVVAIGSVLFGNYEKGSLIMGNPGKVVKNIDENNIDELVKNNLFYLGKHEKSR